MTEGVDPDLRGFYTERYREDDRLRAQPHGVLERLRTRELLLRHLPPPPGLVVDVGGATGVHAEWLVARGYEVVLVDLVAEHVRAAASRVAGVRAVVGDARALPMDDGCADAVLVLGPLYHLLGRQDRLAALLEAVRVARRGAVVAAAAVSRHATVMDLGSQGRLPAAAEPLVRELHETGAFDGSFGFTRCHFHTPDELRGELAAAGVVDPVVYGVEGPAWPALDAHGMDRLDELLESALVAARAVERDPALMAASGHLLGVGRV
jgi:hypothetical protein